MYNDVDKTKSNKPRSVADILDAVTGKNEDGTPKCAMNFSCALYDDVLEETKDINNYSTYNPTVRIERHGDYIQLDMSFDRAMNDNLRSIWAMMEAYGKMLDDFDDVIDDNVPTFNIVILPLSLKGQYFVSLSCPFFWVLQPEVPGSQFNMIRVLFDAETIEFMESDEIDIEEIKAQAEMQNAQEELAEEKLVEKQQEQEEYEAKRAALLEEIRRNPRKFQ